MTEAASGASLQSALAAQAAQCRPVCDGSQSATSPVAQARAAPAASSKKAQKKAPGRGRGERVEAERSRAPFREVTKTTKGAKASAASLAAAASLRAEARHGKTAKGGSLDSRRCDHGASGAGVRPHIRLAGIIGQAGELKSRRCGA